MGFRQSFCFPCFRTEGMAIEALFVAAKEMGYAAVEWWFNDEHFTDQVAAAKRSGLGVASMCGHHSLERGLNCRAEHDRIETELKRSIELAVANQIPNLICFSGNRVEGQSDEDGMLACVDGLRRVSSIAEDAGVTLNLELLNSRIDHPGYQCDRTAWGVAVCERVASPNVKLLYDIYHMQIMEGDVIRTIRRHIRWIGHFHTAGNPGRKDIDDGQELNYPAICRAIRQLGYDGYVAHEFVPAGDRLQALASAFATCQADPISPTPA